MSDSEDVTHVAIGTAVYDEDGQQLGSVRGFDEHGFYVTTEAGIEALGQHHTAGEPGEAELMWRCTNCGEMGDLDDGLPDECPNCGVPKEDLYYWTED